MRLRTPSPSLVISIIALVMATTGTAVAAVSFARNAGAVDGKSAVAATASLNRAAGKLVATNRRGADKGRIPGKFVADVVRGSSQPFGRYIPVNDNANGAPQAITGAAGLGTMTVACNDQAARAGVEDPRVVVTFANGAGSTINISRRVGAGEGFVAPLPAGAVDSFVIGGSDTFTFHAELNLNNLRIEGTVRQDGRGSAEAACLIYGFGLRV
ncbi:MAG TPA: hypothetical protein VF529_01125 [Solirubrobacteraceae bacterium]|jgi:hypothetical protein